MLEAPAHEAVVHLGGGVFLEPHPLLERESRGRLPGEVIAQPDVAHLPLPDQIVQAAQRLLERRIAVPSVYLVQVDVIGLQPLQARLRAAHDVHARRPAAVEVLAHREPDLGGQDDLLPDAF